MLRPATGPPKPAVPRRGSGIAGAGAQRDPSPRAGQPPWRLTQCSLSPPTDSCNASLHPPSPTSRQGQRATPRGRNGSLIELEPGASVENPPTGRGRQAGRHGITVWRYSILPLELRRAAERLNGGTFERRNVVVADGY